MQGFDMFETKDGVLMDVNRTIIKARCINLLSPAWQAAFVSKDKVMPYNIEVTKASVKLSARGRDSQFDLDYWDYVQKLEDVVYYLTVCKVPNEERDMYFLIAKYKYGVVIVAPMLFR